VAALVDLWQRDGAMRNGDDTLYDIVSNHAPMAAPADFDARVVAQLREIIAQTTALPPEFTREALTARLDQFVLETFQIIPAAGDALGREDLAAFGDLVDRSQAAAELWLGNQIPETIALARLARTSGALAASAFGAGFGGSVWALVGTADAPAFLDQWRSRYLANFPDRLGRAEFFLTSAGPPLFRV
jgi:galactokinase